MLLPTLNPSPVHCLNTQPAEHCAPLVLLVLSTLQHSIVCIPRLSNFSHFNLVSPVIKFSQKQDRPQLSAAMCRDIHQKQSQEGADLRRDQISPQLI